MIRFPGKDYLRKFAIREVVRRRLRCMFVLSTGRVGTESLTHLLELSDCIAACHEPSPEFHMDTKEAYQVERWSELYGEKWSHKYLFARFDAKTRETSIKHCIRNRLIYAETSNRLTYVAPLLAEFFPQSKFVLLHRDPREVVRSGMRRQYYVAHEGDKYRITPRPTDAAASEWGGWTPFEKCCWYWSAVNQYALEFLHTLPSERWRTLRSDSMFRCDAQVLGELFEWMGASAPSTEQMQTVSEVRHNRQETGSFPHWKKWSEWQMTRMREIAGPVAVQLGYDDMA